MSPSRKSVVWEYVESILIAAVLALTIRAFVVQAFKIPTGSMRPTLIEGDRILVNKFLYGAKIPGTPWRLPVVRAPRRGDVIVFVAPEDRHRDFIKRFVAMEGDLIEIKNFHLWVNGQRVDDPPVFQSLAYYNYGDYAKAGVPVRVPMGYYFGLGDDSASSRDSRYWGFLPKENLIGKAMVIYWPVRRIRIVR